MKNDAYVSENTDQNTAEERLDLSQFEGHTPGPWAFFTMGADEPYHSVHADGWETWGIQTPITNGADARLIAAAPDLLAALLELVDAIHWEPFSEDDTTLEIDRAVAERIWGKVDA